MCRGLTAVDVQDNSSDEARPLLVEDSAGDLAHPSQVMHGV